MERPKVSLVALHGSVLQVPLKVLQVPFNISLEVPLKVSIKGNLKGLLEIL